MMSSCSKSQNRFALMSPPKMIIRRIQNPRDENPTVSEMLSCIPEASHYLAFDMMNRRRRYTTLPLLILEGLADQEWNT